MSNIKYNHSKTGEYIGLVMIGCFFGGIAGGALGAGKAIAAIVVISVVGSMFMNRPKFFTTAFMCIFLASSCTALTLGKPDTSEPVKQPSVNTERPKLPSTLQPINSNMFNSTFYLTCKGYSTWEVIPTEIVRLHYTADTQELRLIKNYPNIIGDFYLVHGVLGKTLNHPFTANLLRYHKDTNTMERYTVTECKVSTNKPLS